MERYDAKAQGRLMDAITQIMRDEAKRYRLYNDITGEYLPPLPATVDGRHPKRSVGYGRNVDDVPFSDDEIRLMLANDYKKVQIALSVYDWYIGLNEPRKASIENMTFNMGVHGVLGFHHMIAAIVAEDWDTAGIQCDDPHWHSEVGERATRVAIQLRTGVWSD